MLVLTRKHEEETVIYSPEGDSIVIKVLGIKNGEVRLGFDAPRNFKIMRREIEHRQRTLD